MRRIGWLEEYSCGCSNLTMTKKDAVGYCSKHGDDRKRITKIEISKGMRMGHSS